ncbi:hypothetical protein [Nocardiopsis sp. NRRL B-16309]|uniref:hypothetical protein n=1 Tax=Nocardiopsis sp. NRRL B-16309 TaxID=1519494 RepID=UPI0006AED53E|nr:hypothetical protein [Nocardiopsis sp. NRRL B-16309]KOX10187.1 hypothetical protein ADL05_26300 [Nocardiopsis sp. NRRL B-16309]
MSDAYQRGAADMRERAARLLTGYREAPYKALAASIRGLPVAPDATDPHGGEEVHPGSIRRAEDALEASLAAKEPDLEERVDALEELTASLANALEAQSRDITALRSDVGNATSAARGVGKLLREHITAHASHATDVEQRMQAVESAVLPPQ